MKFDNLLRVMSLESASCRRITDPVHAHSLWAPPQIYSPAPSPTPMGLKIENESVYQTSVAHSSPLLEASVSRLH